MMDYSLRFRFHYSILFTVFVLVGMEIFNLMYAAQPEPYIDEIFHVNQTQRFCDYNFEWNDKISTPPGLYIITVVFIKLYSLIYSVNVCSVFALRMFNFIISCMTFHLSYAILDVMHPCEKPSDKWKNLLSALNTAIFPILYFYSFLYYTDNLSLFLVLLMYYFYICEMDKISDVFGLLSVSVRQTNIAWIMCLVVGRIYQALDRISSKMPLYIQRSDSLLFKIKIFYFAMTSKYAHGFALTLINIARCFLMAFGLLGIFAMWNNSFAFGDKSAHTLVFHTSQYVYYYVLVIFFMWPYFLPMIRDIFPSEGGSVLRAILDFCIMVTVMKFGTFVHVYLISDNRHIMFYIWKNFLQYPVVRYSLIPLQTFSMYCVMEYVTDIADHFKLGYLVALIMSITPHKLLDFRYFIVPYVMQRLHMTPGSWWQIILETLNSIIINFIMIYLFLNKPFYWPNGELQRFSW